MESQVLVNELLPLYLVCEMPAVDQRSKKPGPLNGLNVAVAVEELPVA